MYELALENIQVSRIRKYEMTDKEHANCAEKSLPKSILEKYDNYVIMRNYLIEDLIDVQRTLDELKDIEDKRMFARSNPYEATNAPKSKLGNQL